MLKRVGPIIAFAGYVHIRVCIKYESQGVVEMTAIYIMLAQSFIVSKNTDGYEEEDLVDSKTCEERMVEESQGYRRRYRIVQVTGHCVSFCRATKCRPHTPEHNHNPSLTFI